MTFTKKVKAIATLIIKLFSESFTAKVLVALTTFIILISFSFTLFFFQYQYRFLTDNLIKNGNLFAEFLANQTRIGVFSENKTLLRHPVEGALQQKEVCAVSIYNREGTQLIRMDQPKARITMRVDIEADQTVFKRILSFKKGIHLEGNESIDFWAPVVSNLGYAKEAYLFDTDSAKGSPNIIGFVKITLDKRVHRNALSALLLKSGMLGLTFLLIGVGMSIYVVRKVTDPLKSLTVAVKDLESGELAKNIFVKTKDEIGKLANAFNRMSKSLKNRESALRDSEKRLQFLSSHLIEAQEKERIRISKELHDEMGQALALLKHKVRYIQREIKADQISLKEACVHINEYIDQIIENVRRLSMDLSPAILEDLGLSEALEWMANNFSSQQSGKAIIKIDNIDGLFPQDTQICIYRIFQEAFTNIDKHSGAEKISFIAENRAGRVRFSLKDDGKGFNMDDAVNDKIDERGIGLVSMGERSRMIDGAFDIQSSPGKGTKIRLEIEA